MADCKDLDILSVNTTVGSADEAQALARQLLASRLVACVQVEEGLRSHYRWEGRDCDEPEVRLTLKTVPGAQALLEAFLAEHHPYDVPQILGCVMRASAPYAAWVRAEVTLPAA